MQKAPLQILLQKRIL
ncbi:hypothetical protein AVEN_19169-1, partial [Araneus ventricosus]